MNEALEKIQSIFKESQSFALISQKNGEEYKLLAKEALQHTLLKKQINVFSMPDNSEFKKKWSGIIPQIEKLTSTRQTSIRIPKNQCKIKELSYEESGDFFSLLINSESGELNKDALIIEPVPAKAEAAFCFFDPPCNELLDELSKQITLPLKEKMIFITSSETTFAEKTSQIIKTILPDISSSEIATLLYASLIIETDNFSADASQEILKFGGELLSLGAEKDKINNILNKEKKLSFAQLLGRALARTHIDNDFDASWTFLSQKDLEKTDALSSPYSYFYEITQSIRSLIPQKSFSFIFWEKNDSLTPEKRDIFAIAACDNEQKLAFLCRQLNADLSGRFFVTKPFNDFSEAETRFRKALGEMDTLRI